MLDRYIPALRTLVLDPTSNLVATAMGLSIVVLLLVILVLVLLFVALPRTTQTARTPASPKTSGRPRPETRRGRAVFWGVLAGGVLISWVALYAGTTLNPFCTKTCHTMAAPSETWRQSPHVTTRCTRCHEGLPGLTIVDGTVSRARSVWHEVAGGHAQSQAVPSRRCLECHSSILSGTVTGDGGVAMSHKEPLAQGATCADCHGPQGHTALSLAVGMSACLRCHDGQTASAECTVCHPKGADAAIKFADETFGSPVVLPEQPTCGGCHSQQRCDDCHGLRMPHPKRYGDPLQHARPAAFEQKDRICFRCHVPGDCYACHLSFTAHGVPTSLWRGDHKSYTREDGRNYCRWCHDSEDMCALCH